jgi:hypothetical protein
MCIPIWLFTFSMRQPLSPLNNATVAVLKLIRKFPPKNSDHLYMMPPKGRTDKSRCSNLLRGNEVVSVILFHDAAHSVRRTELLQQCQKFLDDSTLLSSPYMVQSNVSPSAFTILWRFSMAPNHIFLMKPLMI